MTHHSNARISIGGLPDVGLYRIPAAAPAQPGKAVIFLGNTPSGLPVTITTTSLEWLDGLESAVQVARAQAVVEAGMTVTA